MSRTTGLTALQLASVAAGAVLLAVGLHGCTSECVDKFDCRRYETINTDGSRNTFTCVKNACVAGDPGGSQGGEASGGGQAGGDADAGTLYERLGGEAGIHTAVARFLTRVQQDNRINAYFLNSSVNGGRLADCLQLQFSAAVGGPGTYSADGGGVLADGGVCRSMKAAHQGLKISQRDFGDLVADLVAVLQDSGVGPDDLAAIGAALASLTPEVVEDTLNTGSLYQRLGRKPSVQVLVDRFVSVVAADARINAFFSNASVIPRLQTCLVRQVCGLDVAGTGPCHYGGEVGPVASADGGVVEPGVSASAQCRGMAQSHAGLTAADGGFIRLEEFDALVEDLVSVLSDAGVDSADIAAVGTSLGPTCSQIVRTGTAADGGTGCP